MNSKKTVSPSRPSQRVSARPSASASKRSRGAVAKLAARKDHAVTSTKSLSRRMLGKVKTKAGMAVAAGVVLAGVGLLRKYRAAH